MGDFENYPWITDEENKLIKEKSPLTEGVFLVLFCFSVHSYGAFRQISLQFLTNLLSFKFDSVNKKPKLWQFCLSILWVLNTGRKTWCQLTTGAENSETKYNYCAEARRLEILSTKQVVTLFCNWAKKLLGYCFLSVPPSTIQLS